MQENMPLYSYIILTYAFEFLFLWKNTKLHIVPLFLCSTYYSSINLYRMTIAVLMLRKVFYDRFSMITSSLSGKTNCKLYCPHLLIQKASEHVKRLPNSINILYYYEVVGIPDVKGFPKSFPYTTIQVYNSTMLYLSREVINNIT